MAAGENAGAADHHMRVDRVSSRPKKVPIVVANPATSTTVGWPAGFWGAEQTVTGAGTVQDNTVSGDWFVIPGSGTGTLAGLRGTGGFRANLGEGAQVHLDYWFE